ncbi:coiled-coil domain-containing 39-like, partial [Paramuricea clavata]
MMETVLSDFPLDEGIAVPVANTENKHLEAELDSKQKEILSNKDKSEEHKERIDAINEHLKNVLQELQHTQELLNARKREINTEDHLKQVAEREEGRLRNEMKRIQNDLNELDSRRNIAENNIFTKTKQLEELKSQMNWDQKALEAWLEESARRDEDALILEKYTRSDESKVKSLSLKTEKMTEESQKKRRDLEHELSRTSTAQVELDKTAEEFRKIHAERQELLEQWESTIEQMQKRDREMDQLAVRLAEFRLEVRSKEDLIQDRQ